ncbi:hypothetical protein MMC11_008016 [Xylographa trunciseda]|nr:hypothetical protein [Xylographa trunciseda]
MAQKLPTALAMREAGDARDCSKILLSKTLFNSSRSEVSDPIERRKRQNRLRQRAWRQRKSVIRKPSTITLTEDTAWEGYGILMITDQHDSERVVDSSVATDSLRSNRQERTGSQLPTPTGSCRKDSNRHNLIPPLLPYASFRTTGQPSPLPLSFPLSADHCLITLVQYNVVRAIMFNMSILSMMDHLPLGCGESLQIPRFGTIPPDMIPSDLQSSPLQKSIPHLFWIDAIPFPKVRDNLILMSGKYDSDDLFYDLGQGLYEGFDDAERRGYLVWGDPWSLYGWEISEGFVRKWGFLLAGCADVIESANRWREIRGEDRLIVEV